MYLTVQALVLRVTPYNDTDALLTVLTANQGKLTLKARGLRRKNSPLVAPCQLLAYAEFTLFEYKGMYTINEARTIELFSNLRKDLSKLTLGSYFAQVSEVIAQEDSPSTELLSLVLNSLYVLTNCDYHELLVKSVFELRSVCIAGYTPDLSYCHNCGNDNPDLFDLSAGCLECRNCRNSMSNGIRLPVSLSVLSAMRYIINCPHKRLFSFSVGEQTLENLSQITESYLSTQFERGFSTLDFYKSLTNLMDTYQ